SHTTHFYIYLSSSPPYPHSFPTRRSSDLLRGHVLVDVVEIQRPDHPTHGYVRDHLGEAEACEVRAGRVERLPDEVVDRNVDQVGDRKSTRLNSSHDQISYAVFCLKKKKKN